MNRNSENHYTSLPHANIQRSRFDRSYSHLTTINEGDIVPIYVDELLPGDTVSIDLRSLMRMATPLYPIMDNAYCDFYFFAVPNRLLWDHWEEFCGANKTSYWAQKTEYTVPQLTAPADSWTGDITKVTYDSKTGEETGTETLTNQTLRGWKPGTLADYMGLPTMVGGLSVNALPFRAYGLIYNEWFRDENLQQPQLVSTGDETTAGQNEVTDQTGAECGAKPLKACKFHDRFTSCLPEPQKGEGAAIPITGAAQIWTNGYRSATELSQTESNTGVTSIYASGLWVNNETYNKQITIPTTAQTTTSKGELPDSILSYGNGLNNASMWADLGTGVSVTINELRQAIAIQHLLEADARQGTRYREVLLGHFGVSTPDSRMQIPEYIGGYRIPIQVSQVIQNSATDSTSPQGNTAAYSLTTSARNVTTYSSTEHCILMGLAVIRVDQSYQQGIDPMWTRSDRFSYYWPELANLGEQAVLNKEIYAQGTDEDDEVFGYQEAWSEYRYHNNMVTGEMRSNYGQSLDPWHYAQFYGKLPSLSSSWIQEDEAAINRTIAVSSAVSHQFICDFYFDAKYTRPMPIYSVPGLDKL